MSDLNQRSMDIAFFDMRPAASPKKGPSCLQILLWIFGAIAFLAIGFALGVAVGLIQPPPTVCCGGVIALEFDFNFEREGPS